jgi:hypothetical protein
VDSVPDQQSATPAQEHLEGEDIPAIYINRFHIITGPVTTRITFSESMRGLEPSFPRVAVAMKTTDAEELANALLTVIALNRKQLQEQHDASS